jgi:pyrimidine oxygenase
MKLGVFLPIANNGWLVSTTSPQYMPTWNLNLEVTKLAEQYQMDFALSMIKFRGFGGPSQYWDHSLESFTLMASLAAVTQRIELFASVSVLTMPPALCARMCMTIDEVSGGRFGLNIVSGWQRAEFDQMGLWPGEDHYKRRYEYCAEYVDILRELWSEGRSSYSGDFFNLDDCRLSPTPSRRIPLMCAAQSDAGAAFSCQYSDYNFCPSYGINEPERTQPGTARLVEQNRRFGTACGGLVLVMIVADETDELATAKWEHYKAGADIEALAWRDGQISQDTTTDPTSMKARFLATGGDKLPASMGVFVGSYETVAMLLDTLGGLDGVSGAMLVFDDFVLGMKQFGERIQPLMKRRDLSS